LALRIAIPGAIQGQRARPEGVMTIDWRQIVGLFILAIPIACIARTVIFEEVFREPREWCVQRSQICRSLVQRKFFYLFTCEYCFSHYVTAAFLLITRYKLLYDDWRGYLVAFFSLVFVANAYLNLYNRLRLEIASEKKTIEVKEKSIEASESADDAKVARPRRVG
jgi:hypothetical protein